MSENNPVLTISELSICFPEQQNFVAVNKLSCSLGASKNLAIVGESGSGKSLLALSIVGLQPPNAQIEGQIIFEGKN
ncbi:MAG: ATP-binding cassette domain-containing protein, partial [Chitinophagaceae bacterium]|nr:ATP-binding cassette domain-containing protein [Chitinophagaceae bacterium]